MGGVGYATSITVANAAPGEVEERKIEDLPMTGEQAVYPLLLIRTCVVSTVARMHPLGYADFAQ